MENSSNQLPEHHFESHALRSDLSFDIDRFSRMHPDVRAPYPHRNQFFTIHYIEQGRGRHVIDFESHSVQAGSLFFITPGQVHFWQLEGGIQGRVIRFKQDFLLFASSEQDLFDHYEFFFRVDGPPCIMLNQEQAGLIGQTMILMQAEYESDTYGQLENLQCYLRILLNQIQGIFLKKQNKAHSAKKSAVIKKFKKLVSRHFKTQNSVPFYSDQLGVSEFHLYDTVKKAIGMTPGQIIRNEIILEAKRLLAHTEMTVAEIGYMLGFEDPAYFSRFFKRETRFSPTAFRSHIQEKYQTFTG